MNAAAMGEGVLTDQSLIFTHGGATRTFFSLCTFSFLRVSKHQRSHAYGLVSSMIPQRENELHSSMNDPKTDYLRWLYMLAFLNEHEETLKLIFKFVARTT